MNNILIEEEEAEVFKKKSVILTAILLVVTLFGIAACTPADIQALKGTLQNIDSASGNVTVTLSDGTTRTFNFNNVSIETIKQALGNGTLDIGDNVTIKVGKNGDVRAVDVNYARVSGIVKSIGTDNITVTAKNGDDITLQVSSDTTITNGGADSSLSALRVGQAVNVKYEVSSLKALKITVGTNYEESSGTESESESESESETETDSESETGDNEKNEKATGQNTVTGIVTSFTNNRLTVDGRTIRITRHTRIIGTISVGSTVEIKFAWADESHSASSITVINPGTIPPTTPPSQGTVPAAPSGLQANLTGTNQAILNWTDNSNNENGFKIQRATTSAFTTGMTTFVVGPGMTTYINIALAANTTYYYRVVATNASGDSTPSNVVSILTSTSSTSISGAAVFAANCTGCHGLSRATNSSLTQAQLLQFIPNHNTGRNLNPAEIAALAAYIKP